MLITPSSIFVALGTPAKPNRDVPRNALLCSLMIIYAPFRCLSIFPSALTVCSNPPFSYLPCFLVTCISNCDVPRPCLPCFSNLDWNVLRALTVVLTMRCFHLFDHPSLCSPQMASLPLPVFSLFVFTHHLSYLISGNLHIEL